MAHRSPARWLAPIVLLAALAAVGLVVQSTTGDGKKPASSSKTSGDGEGSTQPRSRTTKTSTTGSSSEPKSYRVKTGDTLGNISESTGVPVTDLQELNPDLDPQSLTVGQRIRLRR